MSAASWEDIERLFDHVVQLPEAERDVWLAEQDSAPEVLDTVRRLVAADGGAEDRFLQPIVDPAKPTQRRAGPYALLEELGRGGMGVVYRAVRVDGAFDDEVAVKVLAAGPAGSDRQLRFLKERQILATVRHPHIAYLLDGGWTEDQRPYLAMEWVRGRPIDVYCEDRRLTVRERIRLVLQVAGALEHAHRNLVVHRDVKPSNVLVIETGELASGTGQRAEGMVKLLDFGIAKLIADDHESQTRTGQKLMTLAYASPEQIRGEVVTTASDVYQLGLLLYLLITGRLPYRVDAESPLSLARAVVEQEPIAASRHLSGDPRATVGLGASADPGDDAAEDRRPAPSGRHGSPAFDDEPYSRGEKRDLDAILLTALAKEPAQRYGSAREMAEDLERFLAGEPVRAREQGRLYRWSKWARRHRAATAAVAATALLTISVTLSGILALAQAERLEAERNHARQESEKASQITGFLSQVFAGANPDARSGPELTAKELLDSGAARIAELDDPAVRLPLLDVMARSYSRLGLFDSARALGGRQLALARQSGETAAIAQALEALAHTEQGAGSLARAETHQREALALRRQLDDAVDLARTLLRLGQIRGSRGAWREAIAWGEQAQRAMVGHPEAITLRFEILATLGEMRHLLGELDEAADLHQRALTLIESSGVLSTDWPKARQNLGMVRYQQGRQDRAEPLMRQAVEEMRQIYGGDHYLLAATLSNLGLVVEAAGRPEEALALYEEALEMRRRVLPEDHPEIANSLHNLGSFRIVDEPVAAEAWLRDALERRRRSLGADHPSVANTLSALADALWVQERLAESLPLRREVLAIRLQHLPADHPDVAHGQKALRRTLERLGQAAGDAP